MKTTSAISLRRSLAVMALLLAVLVVALASSPPAAQAQTTVTLVSNTGQSNASGNSAQQPLGQRFRTGGNATGYNLASVGIALRSLGTDSNVANTATVTLRKSTSAGRPGDVVYTFTSPTLAANSVNTFTAPDGAVLSANTNYILVIESTSGIVTVSGTTSAAEDAGAATGFNIANERILCTSPCTSWDIDIIAIFQIRVSGSAIEPLPVVQFLNSAYSVGESDSTFIYKFFNTDIIITGTRQGDVSVDYTISGSGSNAATPCPTGSTLSSCLDAGYDFLTTLDNQSVAEYSRTVTFDASDNLYLLSLASIHDTADEPNETFTITLSDPIGATLGTKSVRTITIVDNDEAVPAAPTNLRSTAVRALDVILAWDAVTGADSYQYRVQNPEGVWSAWTDQTETGSGTSTRVRGLAPASAYGFQVRAVNSIGTGAASATLAVTTGTLSWTVATDETGYTEGDDIAVTVSAATSYGGNCPSGFPLSLALTVADPDEVLSDAATRSLNFSACQSSKTETFATVDDSVDEDAAAVTFTLAVAQANTTPHLADTLGATPPSAQVTVADNDEPATLPVIQFSSSTYSFDEPAATVTESLPFTITGNVQSGATVNYMISSSGSNPATACPTGVASCGNAGYDFSRNVYSGTLFFASGDTGDTFAVLLLADTTVEEDETFTVTLSSPNGMTLGTNSVATVTIVDDDEPAPNTNNPPTGVPTITGTPQVGRTLTADTSGIGDADGLGTFAYQWIRGAAANIAGATGSTYRAVAADIGHTLKVRVSWTDGGGTAESLTSAPTAPVTDSTRSKLLFSGGLAETEGSGEASVWAIVQPASSEDISFRVHTSDYALAEAGRDYVALDRIVTIPAGETYAAFPVRLIDDSIAEHHEQFTITVSQVRGAELHYARYAGGGVWGPDGHGPHGRISDFIEIRDDDGGDAAVITLMTLHEPRRAPEVVEGGVIEIMVNRRGGPDTGDVSVTVNVAESGGDRVASGDEGRRTVTLERGFENARYRSTYYLRIPTRATGGGDGRLVVTVEDGTGYTVGEQSRVTVKLIDRAAPTPTVTLRAVRNSAPEGEDLEFTLTRTGAVEGALRVGVEVSETGHLVTGSPSVVRIEDGERSATFTVETFNDPDNGTGSVVTVSLTEDAERYRLGGPSSARVRVTDARSSNQAARLPEVSISAAAQSAAEGAALTFTLTSTEAAEAELAVGLEVSESGAMLAAYPVRVGIPAGAASAAFDILTLNDETDEADSVVTVSIAEDGETYETGDPSSVSVTVTDDDETAATPLTAGFTGAPATHDGEDAFTFRIAFSEAVAASYRTLRDQALEVTGGSVTRARRVDGRSDLWEITIEPNSDAEVTVVLPVTESCDAEGAVCNGDGGMLSNRLELTIPGPVEEEEQQTPPENSPATGSPGITGTARVGETLTAGTSGVADE